MRIAVASEGLCVSPHFACCTSFTFYKIRHGVITECQNMPNPLLTMQNLTSLFQDFDVQVLITGAIDKSSADFIEQANIEVVSSVTGTARDATKLYLNQTLAGSSEDETLSLIEA